MKLRQALMVLAMLVAMVALNGALAQADTFINVGPGTVSPDDFLSGENAGDNRWDHRAEGGFFSDDLAQGYSSENPPELTLTADVNADLEGPGLYDVFVQFGRPTSFALDASGVSAAIGVAALVDYDGNSAPSVGTNGPWTIHEASLGSVNSSGTIDVRMDQHGTDRSWIDSVRFEMVPEPSSLLLLLVGAVALMSARRRHG